MAAPDEIGPALRKRTRDVVDQRRVGPVAADPANGTRAGPRAVEQQNVAERDDAAPVSAERIGRPPVERPMHAGGRLARYLPLDLSQRRRAIVGVVVEEADV